jgi:hypothetical protein
LVSPDIGDGAQEVINSQIGNEYDIFLGVMWSRYGSKTLSAESGTHEEFDRAFDRRQAGERVKLSFLFCTADIPQDQLDGMQYDNVQRFKKSLQEQGCLTRNFADDALLINAVNIILDQFANGWNKSDSDAASNPLHRSNNRQRVSPSSADGGIEKADDDDGLLDVSERFEEHVCNFNDTMVEWAKQLKKWPIKQMALLNSYRK